MSMWSRLANLFRADRLNREIDEELQSHVDEAIAQGRDPAEARRALGPALRLREESRDVRLVAWLDSLRADAIFGWRQLTKNKVTSAAATLSLALAIGSCTAAFRLIDALLLRPLPIADPERLYVVAFERILPGQRLAAVVHSCSYPLFREMRATVKDDAELVAVSYAQRVDVTYGAYQEMEKAYRQYVSGWMFSTLGLRPALGRVLTGEDDLRPGAHPYAVLSYDYWTRRFGREPQIIGRTFRMGNDVYEVVGVLEERFSGTEPGTPVDIFVPTMMNAASINRPNHFWFRTFVRPRPDAAVDSMRERLQAMYLAWERERAEGFTNFPKERLAQQINQTLRLDPAVAGVSSLQKDYRLALAVLAILVALVLLIACANVANLMTARAAARSREMALRVSIGAGRRRLVQLVLLEAAWIALLAAAIGTVFASWAAPFIVSMINPPDNPARLFLPTDWRVLGFGLALTLMVTCLFGLLPARRASGVRPMAALKGGEDPPARRQTMHALIAVQVAFCFVVLFIGNLFVATQNQLESQPLGFAAERLLVLETVSQTPQVPAYWDDVAEGLRAVPGVERVAMSRWPLLGGEMSNNFVWIAGAPPADVLTFFLEVSPDWRDAMKIPLTSGRDFRANDRHPGVALVNATFARQYVGGEDPVGSWFETREANGSASRFEIPSVAILLVAVIAAVPPVIYAVRIDPVRMLRSE